MNKGTNVLNEVAELISMLPAIFREKVCEDCNWSTPTFYRKLKARERPHPLEKGKTVSYLSKAERDKVLEITYGVFNEFGNKLSAFRNSPNNEISAP